MSAFLDALRENLAAASPAPWEWRSNDSGYPVELLSEGVGVLRPAIHVGTLDGKLAAHISNDGDSAEDTHPDFTLIVLLRNAAPEIAAVLQAACALRHYDDPTVLLNASELAPLRAALAALDAKVTP